MVENENMPESESSLNLSEKSVKEPEGEEKAAIESAEHRDKYLRLYAEFENYKKRMAKEKADFLKFALEDFILEIVGAMSNFDRAKKSLENGAAIEKVVEGIDMVYRQIMGILNKKGLEPIEAYHKPFDPECHEAIGFVESDEHPDHTVLEEIQKGFKLQGRLLRPALVQISRQKKSHNNTPEQENKDQKDS